LAYLISTTAAADIATTVGSVEFTDPTITNVDVVDATVDVAIFRPDQSFTELEFPESSLPVGDRRQDAFSVWTEFTMTNVKEGASERHVIGSQVCWFGRNLQ
jgi:hypothetical protein